MLIDSFINSKKDNLRPGGSNKTCFIFDEYVLLYGSFKEEDLKKEIIISNKLKQNGISILPTLEYKIVIPANENGYAKGYILQPRAKGDWLYNRNMKDEDYKKRLKQISNMEYTKLDKFISDWLNIVEAGLQVDPSKGENFFYSDDGICFIDLNLRQGSRPLKITFLEVVSVLTGLGLVSTVTDDVCVKIIKNVARSFSKRGLSANDIHEVLSSHDYLLGNYTNKKQIDSIIKSFTKEQEFKEASTNLKEEEQITSMKQFRKGRFV